MDIQTKIRNERSKEIKAEQSKGNLLEFEGKKIVTQGDANNTEDKPIIKELVVGKVIHIFSNVEVWMNVIKTPEVILSGIGTIGVIGFLFAGNSHQKKKKKIKVNSKED